MNIYKALSLGMYMLAWFDRASKDGKITQEEIVEGVYGAVRTIGINVEIDVPYRFQKSFNLDGES